MRQWHSDAVTAGHDDAAVVEEEALPVMMVVMMLMVTWWNELESSLVRIQAPNGS
jgi:hypothetical protein